MQTRHSALSADGPANMKTKRHLDFTVSRSFVLPHDTVELRFVNLTLNSFDVPLWMCLDGGNNPSDGVRRHSCTILQGVDQHACHSVRTKGRGILSFVNKCKVVSITVLLVMLTL